MQIFIQARKDGYNVLYPTPTPTEFYQFASDIQSASADNNPDYYGKNFYALAFASDGCIFTKYVIGYDVQRGDIGNVGISVFIPNTEKLSGENLKELLDKLLNIYCSNYCPDNNISDKREDWDLFTSLANNYDVKLQRRSTHNDTIITGTQDPAFLYYKDGNDLIEHLDKPFQEEYSNYKKILFIDKNLQSTANPLRVLKNSGVEVIPDLKNEYYFLNNYNRSKGVSIIANGKSRSEGKDNNSIRAKWQVEINYSKEYYKPIVVSGSISNLDSDIHKYLDINGSNINIEYDAFQPNPETKTVTFDVVTKKDGTKVTGAEIQVDTRPWQSHSEVTFKGVELGREHKITARIGDTLFSDVVKITPKYYSNNSIRLLLIEKKVVKIVVTEAEGVKNYISDFKVWINGGKCDTQQVSEVTFTGEEIDNTWNITVEKEGFERSTSMSYNPKNGDKTISFELKKAQISTGEPSSYGGNNPTISEGNSKLKTFTKKVKTFLPKRTVIATSIVGGLVISVGIWAFLNFFDNDKPFSKILLSKNNIENYVEGDSLILKKLEDYKENWKRQEQNFITKSGGGIFGGEEEGDSLRCEKDWKSAYESIDRAIIKRELINNKNFEELLKQGCFNGQSSLKTAIKKIGSTQYEEISTQLGDVSTLTLTKIAEKINEILKPKDEEEKEDEENVIQQEQQEPNKEENVKTRKDEPEYITNYLKSSSNFRLDSIKKHHRVKGLSKELNRSLILIRDFLKNGYKNCETFKTKAKKDKFFKENENLDSWVNEVCKDKKNTSNNEAKTLTNNTSEIIQYIKGSELDEVKLKEYIKTKDINQNLKNSIQLCLEFWKLDGVGNGKNAKTYWTFQKKLNTDNNFKNSKLKAFIEKMCKEGVNPSYSKMDKKKGLKN